MQRGMTLANEGSPPLKDAPSTTLDRVGPSWSKVRDGTACQEDPFTQRTANTNTWSLAYFLILGFGR